MRLYAVRDAAMPLNAIIAYLFYDDASRRFFMELPDTVDEWDAPFLFGSFVRRGIRSISSEWSARWVAGRIVPTDRQNLGMILKDNGLKEYDPYRLLVLADGRCAQDDCYIEAVDEYALPASIKNRLQKKVLDVIPLAGYKAMVLFRDSTVRVINLQELLEDDLRFLPLWHDPDLFCRVHVTPLGNGIEWDEERGVAAETLYRAGKALPLSADDITSFTKYRVVDTSEAAKRLHCSRQYINQLTTEGRLHPLKSSANGKQFLLREIEALG